MVTPGNWNIGFESEAPHLSLFIDRIQGSQLDSTKLNINKFLILASVVSTVHLNWRSCISLNILFEHKTIAHSDLAQQIIAVTLPAAMCPRQIENILDTFVEKKIFFLIIPKKGSLLFTYDNMQILDDGTSRGGVKLKRKEN